MRVWRVQDASGRGPYRPGLSERWMDEQHHVRNEGPLAFRRADLLEHSGWGFLSEGAAKRWFSRSERRRLLQLGFELVNLDADLVVVSSARQCLFSRTLPLSLASTPAGAALPRTPATDAEAARTAIPPGRFGRPISEAHPLISEITAHPRGANFSHQQPRSIPKNCVRP